MIVTVTDQYDGVTPESSPVTVTVVEGGVGTDGATGPQGPQGDTGPAGPAGADGADGTDGADGASAYEVAVAGGFIGTEAEWLASLVGPQGPQGDTGATGPQGDTGPQGPAGADGEGVPVGGSAGQVLAKASATDYDTEWVEQPSGGSAHVIEDEGVDQTARSQLNFTGAGVTVTDDAGNDRTIVTIPGSSGGLSYSQVTDVPGTAYTAGDWTASGGTWSSDGTWITAADPGAAHRRIVRKTAERIDLGVISAVEAEIQIPASGFVGVGTQYIGVGFGPLTAGAGAVVVQATSTGQIHLEKEEVVGIATASFTWVAGTTYRLGLKFLPDGRAAGYVDGVLVIGPSVMQAGAAPQAACLKVYDTAAKFKNIKAWVAGSPNPWA